MVLVEAVGSGYGPVFRHEYPVGRRILRIHASAASFLAQTNVVKKILVVRPYFVRDDVVSAKVIFHEARDAVRVPSLQQLFAQDVAALAQA